MSSCRATNGNPYSFIPSPPWLAEAVADEIDIRPEHRLLEPNVGEGALVMPLLQRRTRLFSPSTPDVIVPGTSNLILVEIDTARVKKLDERLRPNVLVGDFLAMSQGVLGTFDRIAMNPPFEKDADAKHIAHAAELLRPGGRLVAVAGQGFVWRERGLAPKVRKTLHAAGRVRFDELPADTFKASKTSVKTVLVVFDKA